jgi:hypothetical protein
LWQSYSITSRGSHFRTYPSDYSDLEKVVE